RAGAVDGVGQAHECRHPQEGQGQGQGRPEGDPTLRERDQLLLVVLLPGHGDTFSPVSKAAGTECPGRTSSRPELAQEARRSPGRPSSTAGAPEGSFGSAGGGTAAGRIFDGRSATPVLRSGVRRSTA